MLKNLIYLDYHGNQPINLSDEAYEQIKALIEQGKICKECSSHYDEHNPEIARNLCLHCFLGQERYQHMTYVGPYTYETNYSNIRSEYHYQTFIDTKGYLWTISPDLNQNEAREDSALTIKHWGFLLPEQVIREGEVIVLHQSEWSIYGDVHNSVIVGVNNQNNYHGNKTFAFLLYKDKEGLELNKRKGDIRSLFTEARKRLEATKDANGDWCSFEGYRFCYEPHDSHHYAWIAQIEMERMQTRQIALAQPVTVKSPQAKQEHGETKDRPAFGNADWIQIARGKMRPWERAIWKDILGEEQVQ